jgi:glycosyltransferase involved in cell wall biosynthesis
MNQQSISICIATKDRSEDLKKTLRSLADVNVPENYETELVFVDNMSVDNTIDVMRKFSHKFIEVRIFKEPKPGVANARNRAIAEAKGAILLWTDDDVRFPENWIQLMINPIEQNIADVVQGGVEIASHLRRDWMTPRHLELFASTEWLNDPPERLVTANLAMKKTIFNAIPGFDAELGPGALGFGEDTLLGWQIKEAGFTVMLKNDVKVTHCFSESRLNSQGLREIAKRQGKSEAYISYHWNHRKWSPLSLIAGIIYFSCHLYLKRAMNLNKLRNNKIIPLWEYDHIRRITRLKRHLIERKKDRKYSIYGLKKRE